MTPSNSNETMAPGPPDSGRPPLMETQIESEPVVEQSQVTFKRGLSISELILLTVFALISVAVKQMLRLDLNMPGHSYVVYIFCLVFAPWYVNRRGAAVYLGMAAGIFAVISGSRKGVLDLFRFLFPGFAVELARYLPTLGHPLVNRILEGVMASLVMHVTKSGINLIAGKPWDVVLLKFYPGLVTYPAIGCACGICAYFMYQAVKRYKS